MQKGEPLALLFYGAVSCRAESLAASCGLFCGGNREFDDGLDLLVEFGGRFVLADGLDALYGDQLAVEFDAFGSQCLGQVGGGNRTEVWRKV